MSPHAKDIEDEDDDRTRLNFNERPDYQFLISRHEEEDFLPPIRQKMTKSTASDVNSDDAFLPSFEGSKLGLD